MLLWNRHCLLFESCEIVCGKYHVELRRGGPGGSQISCRIPTSLSTPVTRHGEPEWQGMIRYRRLPMTSGYQVAGFPAPPRCRVWLGLMAGSTFNGGVRWTHNQPQISPSVCYQLVAGLYPGANSSVSELFRTLDAEAFKQITLARFQIRSFSL